MDSELHNIGELLEITNIYSDMGYLDFEQSKNALLSVFNAVYDDTVSHTTNAEQADIYGLVAVRLNLQLCMGRFSLFL